MINLPVIAKHSPTDIYTNFYCRRRYSRRAQILSIFTLSWELFRRNFIVVAHILMSIFWRKFPLHFKSVKTLVLFVVIWQFRLISLVIFSLSIWFPFAKRQINVRTNDSLKLKQITTDFLVKLKRENGWEVVRWER